MSGVSAQGKECSEDEKIVRAIRSSDWDPKRERWSSNLFKNQGTSVSRLKILSLKRLNAIFCEELHKPPVHKVQATGVIQIGDLKNIGRAYIPEGETDPKPVDIIVIEKRTDSNPAHAEIHSAPKITRSLAFTIIQNLDIKKSPPCDGWKSKLKVPMIFLGVLSFIALLLFVFLG